MLTKRILRIVLGLAAVIGLLLGQSITSGDITGTVTDSSDAVLTGVTVTLQASGTGLRLTTSTNAEGFYRFALLAPGQYAVSVNPPGFQKTERIVDVQVGQASTVNLKVALETASQVLEVGVALTPIQTENADLSSTFTTQQVALLPNPGNDLTFIAQTAPGVVMNTQSGYGNFSTFGLPASANLFTLNGQSVMDPFFNLNNSGATNLLLGQNEVAEVTVVNNGYSGQYGQLAGSQVNYVTKSGDNEFHGNATYYWNGRAMNANNWFNNAASTPRPFVNVNQWGASAGGPIWKNHTFFFADYEGLRVVLPTSAAARIPSPEFAAATLANLNATGFADSVAFYRNIFDLYKSAPGASDARPVERDPANDVQGAGCGGFTGLPSGAPCVMQFRSTAGNFTHEYLASGRVDQMLGRKDRAFLRLQTDRGVQASYTDPINPIFNGVSTQPSYQGQLSETHVFGTAGVNQFIASGAYYSALFSTKDLNATLAKFPTTLILGDGSFTMLGGINFVWPQGRKITQYQFIDDFSHNRGNHTIKTGISYRRNDITDMDYGLFTSGQLVEFSLQDFFDGSGGNFLLQNFPTRLSQPIAVYGLGGYVQDEWRVTPHLRLTLTLRLDHSSNPVCQTNCFALLTAPFTSLVHDVNIPYNQAIRTGLHQAYPRTDTVVWQPRLGFAWTPFAGGRTVIRGGGGIFGDSFPAFTADRFSSNPPLLNSFTIGNAPLSPDQPGNLFSLAAEANRSFVGAFGSGGTLDSITAANPYFVAPGISTSDEKIRQPRYQEWNLEVQQALPLNMTFSANYVGNHGIREAVLNSSVNGFCPPATCPSGFSGLPSVAPDPRFGSVTQIHSSGVSNYNGLILRLQRRLTRSFQAQVNYTWSHALDTVSNGGLLWFNYGSTDPSLLYPQNPHNIRQYNYGNADYDARHYFSMNYLWEDAVRHMLHRGPDFLFKGWTISGTMFRRTGLPFTVIDTAASNALAATNYGAAMFASVVGKGPSDCGKSAAGPQGVACLQISQFAPSTSSPSGFGNQSRNQFRGPGYFNTDLTIMKNTPIPGWEGARLGIGFQFFNILNHPNFDQPVNDIANTGGQTGFGHINRTVSSPTSIFGAFLGGDASPRLIQLKAQITF